MNPYHPEINEGAFPTAGKSLCLATPHSCPSMGGNDLNSTSKGKQRMAVLGMAAAGSNLAFPADSSEDPLPHSLTLGCARKTGRQQGHALRYDARHYP